MTQDTFIAALLPFHMLAAGTPSIPCFVCVSLTLYMKDPTEDQWIQGPKHLFFVFVDHDIPSVKERGPGF